MKFWKAVCGVTLLFYMIGSFIEATLNPFEWEIFLRALLAISWGVCVVMVRRTRITPFFKLPGISKRIENGF